MKQGYNWGRCAICNIKMKDGDVGGIIEAEEVLVCRKCELKHTRRIISDIESFKQGKGYHRFIDLRNKLLWASERLGHWFDAGDKSYQENISDYNGMSVFELQLYIVDMEITLIENMLQDENGIPIPESNPALWRLRNRLLKEHSGLTSNLDRGEDR